MNNILFNNFCAQSPRNIAEGVAKFLNEATVAYDLGKIKSYNVNYFYI